MKKIYNFYRLLVIFIKGVWDIALADTYFFYAQTIKMIEQELATENITLTKAQRKRFFTYSVVGVVMFSSALRTLTGRRLTKKQQEVSQLFTLLTPIIDDLSDEFYYTTDEIKLITQKKTVRSENVWERIAIKIGTRIEELNQRSLWHGLTEKIIDYQGFSRLQENGNLSETQLRDIIYNKGGISIQLNHDTIMNESGNDLESQCFFGLGAIVQLTNDIFDVFKDRNNQTQTLVTDCRNILILRKEYDDLVETTFSQIKKLPYPKKNIHDFLLQMMVLISRGRVALDHLEKAQQTTDNIFQPALYARRELITDMEKVSILWRSFQYNLEI